MVLTRPIQANPDGDFGTGNVEMSNGTTIALKNTQAIKKPLFNMCARGLPELVRGRISPRLANDQEVAHKDPELEFN